MKQFTLTVAPSIISVKEAMIESDSTLSMIKLADAQTHAPT